MKKILKVCLHFSQTLQISLQFHNFFEKILSSNFLRCWHFWTFLRPPDISTKLLTKQFNLQCLQHAAKLGVKIIAKLFAFHSILNFTLWIFRVKNCQIEGISAVCTKQTFAIFFFVFCSSYRCSIFDIKTHVQTVSGLPGECISVGRRPWGLKLSQHPRCSDPRTRRQLSRSRDLEKACGLRLRMLD